ncbi:MAG: VanW family protein [Oscillospiraceae bacterium]|nr:VanW family protein [Oscillospiraceae bacterium]
MKHSKSASGKSAVLLIAAVLLGLLILAVGYFMLRVATLKTIYPNVYIAGINVGGMTKEKATDALNAQLLETYGGSTLEVQLPDRTLEFTPELVGAKLNTDEAVASAWSYGRYGNLFSRISAYLKAKRSETAFTVNAGLTLNEDQIRALIEQTAEEVKTDVRSSSSVVHADENYIEVTIGQTGVSLDTESLYDTVCAAIQLNDFTPITFAYTETAYPALDLTSLYNDLSKEVADAYYDAEKHEIVEEQIGYGFDLAAANQKVAMAEDGEVLKIQLEEIQPEVTKAHLEEIYFADVLSSWQTVASGNYNRVTNLTLACKGINGTVLAPGEVFSYNDTLGQRTKEKGYLEAGAYVSGKSVTEVGGGICQVSSTLYYCALLANLDITVRSCHMFTVSYLPLGLDATVNWGTQDFQFKNDTEYPIRIEASVSGGMVNVSLIGTKADNIKVEMTYEVLATIPYTTTTTTDASKVTSSGHTGYNVVTYRHLIDATTGEEISSKLEDYSYYQKSDIVVLQQDIESKAEELETEPEETTTAATTATTTAAGSGVVDPPD